MHILLDLAPNRTLPDWAILYIALPIVGVIGIYLVYENIQTALDYWRSGEWRSRNDDKK
jgi:hypothetical protein